MSTLGYEDVAVGRLRHIIDMYRDKDRAAGPYFVTQYTDEVLAGPYFVTQCTDEVLHADPCECDEDNEGVGGGCMEQSDWYYALCTMSAEWIRPLLRLPKRPLTEDDGGPVTDWPVGLMGAGASLIAKERQRQIEAEGYTAEHDRSHADGELLDAAYGYLRAILVPKDNDPYDGTAHFGGHPDFPPHDWPWAPVAWKPTPDDPIRHLVKAAALIAAEIDRLVETADDEPGDGAWLWGERTV